ncbi:MAG TPA: hypothetical protein VK698_32245 [Kofleriaceae bacterium]|nr:hypothetical protein [Kofleriaceae bacterium]
MAARISAAAGGAELRPEPGGDGAATAVAGGSAAGSALKVWLMGLLAAGIVGGVAAGWFFGRGGRQDGAPASAGFEAANRGSKPAAGVGAGAGAGERTGGGAGERAGADPAPTVSGTRSPAGGASAPRRTSRGAGAGRHTSRGGSDLDREVAFLTGARRALQSGEPARALAALERHRRELRAPQMAREAALLRAEALCAAGRPREGRRALAEADARWPGAPGSAAARALCGAPE